MSIQPDSLIPDDDQQRLRSLHHYQILNTTPEKIFDEYVALSAQLFNLPVSLMSLVDEQEVFFKANTGLPGLEPVGRADSLCSAAVLQSQVLVFEDLSEQSCRFINPYVAQSAGMRFYAGAALRMPDGANIGTLCVMGREARAITDAEEGLLSVLAELVSSTIGLRYNYLLHNRPNDWQAAQTELQELLHDASNLARYLTSRTGTVSTSGQDLQPIRQRLAALHSVLDRRAAEFAVPPAS